MKLCDNHPEYDGSGQPPATPCELCWNARKRAVGCLQADRERDEAFGTRKYNTLIKVPFAGSGHFMS
jgi:hypothetical protein